MSEFRIGTMVYVIDDNKIHRGKIVKVVQELAWDINKFESVVYAYDVLCGSEHGEDEEFLVEDAKPFESVTRLLWHLQSELEDRYGKEK